MRSVHVSRVMPVSVDRVYAFASELGNLHLWAGGLASAPVQVEGRGVAVDSPMGKVWVRFVPRNSFGILDHDVELPDGTVINIPMRVLTHPQGAEVVCTVRQLGLTAVEFDDDCAAVARDLEQLATLV